MANKRGQRPKAAKAKRAVMRQGLSTTVAGMLRGGLGTPDIVAEFHRLTRIYSTERLTGLNQFIIKNSFAVDPADYGSALRFGPKQISQLAQVQHTPAGVAEDNWLELAVAYLLVNIPRIERWISFDAEASIRLLRQEPEAIRTTLLELPPVDQQSMLSMRLYASLHAYSDSAIQDYLDTNLTSAWVKGRLLYPLIFYAINQPSPTALAQMLEHLMPTDKAGKEEHKLISFLLRPQDDLDASLSYRCYVGLMGHPYDALEYVTHYVEIALAQRRVLSEAIKANVQTLGATFPAHRIAKLSRLLGGERFEFLDDPPRLFETPEDDAVTIEVSQLLDARRSTPDVQNPYPLFEALRSLRWNLYPVKADYDLIDAYRYRFTMLSAGSFVDWLTRSLFLFEREPYPTEETSLFRGTLMCGGMLPLLMMGPHGPSAMTAWSNSIGPSASTVRTSVEATFGAGKQRTDRLWISAANWSIAQHQRQGKLLDWAAEARSTFPIWLEPRYLSGLDWRWLSDVIDEVGVLPFRGQPNGVYVLFLHQVEQSLREYTALRLALELKVVRGDPLALFDWLTDEFGRDALAIIRTVLLPDTILKLRLADNYTAALTTRLTLLEAGVRKFQFVDGVLSEEDLKREASALTASLSRMSLGARQFELPWDTLKTDAITRNQAAFDAHLTMTSAIGDSAPVTNARRVSTYPFANGAVGEYEGRNRDWPMIVTIAGIIDTFLSHPTAGIEAILSVRIRHDAFRRELINAVLEVSRAPIVGVMRSTKQKYAEAADRALSREINAWLDSIMHTARKGKDNALFNFVPTRAQMTALLNGTEAATSLEEVVDEVFAWVRPILEEQLAGARGAVTGDLCMRLKNVLSAITGKLNGDIGRPCDVERIGAATAAAVERRLKSLEEWFRIPDVARDASLTLQEIYLAVQQRFQPKGKAGRIVFGPLPTAFQTKVLAPDHIRHMYDLLSELVQNAVKHGGRNTVRIRFTATSDDGQQMLLVSNPSSKPGEGRSEIHGHPYATLHESLFGEGNSGCKKIAYLSASIAQRPAKTLIEGRRRSFHVAVPLEAR